MGTPSRRGSNRADPGGGRSLFWPSPAHRVVAEGAGKAPHLQRALLPIDRGRHVGGQPERLPAGGCRGQGGERRSHRSGEGGARGRAYQCPVLGIEAQGSALGSASPI